MTRSSALAEDAQHHAAADHRQGKGADLDLEADQGHQPAGHGRAYIAAVDHRDRLPQGEQAGIDKAQGGHGHGAGGLHRSGDQGPRKQTTQPRARGGLEGTLQ